MLFCYFSFKRYVLFFFLLLSLSIFAKIFKVALFRLHLGYLSTWLYRLLWGLFSWNFKLFHENALATKAHSSWSLCYHSMLHLQNARQFIYIFNIYVTLALRQDFGIERLWSQFCVVYWKWYWNERQETQFIIQGVTLTLSLFVLSRTKYCVKINHYLPFLKRL